jgi:hypothetical protein
MESRGILIAEARQIFSKEFGAVTTRSIRRWITDGVKVKGRVVVLKARRAGLRYVTSREWVDEFIRDCSDYGTEPANFVRRSESASAAERFLIEEGCYGRKAQEQVLNRRL